MARGYSAESPWRRSRVVVPVAQPAAGADWSATVPAGHLYQVVAVFAQLVTSAAVATRSARLSFGDGTATFLSVPPASTQVASLTRLYSWLVSPSALAVGSAILSGIPDFSFQSGWTIGTTTELLDAGDQWSSIRLLVVDTTVKDGGVDLNALPDFLVEIMESGPTG